MEDILDEDLTPEIEDNRNLPLLVSRLVVVLNYGVTVVFFAMGMIANFLNPESDSIDNAFYLGISIPMLINIWYIYYNVKQGASELKGKFRTVFRKPFILLFLSYSFLQLFLAASNVFGSIARSLLDFNFLKSILLLICLAIILRKEFRYLKSVSPRSN